MAWNFEVGFVGNEISMWESNGLNREHHTSREETPHLPRFRFGLGAFGSEKGKSFGFSAD
jgi:hypothetical protein